MTTDQRITDLCRTLRISSVASCFQELAPTQGTEEIRSFLLQALETEVELRAERRRSRAIRTAGFPTVKRFEDLDPGMLPDDGRHYLPMLRSLEFLENHQNILMIGNSGTGKTHLAIATGVCACEQEYRVMFKSVAGLVYELNEAKREMGLTALQRSLKRVDLLILDEMGYVTVDLPGSELLFQVLASRHEASSTIVTSNLMFSEWIKIFHDPILTAALLDRITHRALVMNMNGTSFRQR
jgi:DNA replication protein DnaC